MNDTSAGQALRHGGEAFGRLVNAYPEAAFDGRLAPGGWSGRDHFAHVARYQMVFDERVGRMLRETDPIFSRYRGDEDPGFAEYRGLTMIDLRDRFNRERDILLAGIETLTQADLERRGVHPAYGSITLRRWIDFMIAHEGHHYYQVMRCIAASVPAT